MTGIFSRRGKQERIAFQLYGAAVQAARDPYLYAALGVPDTLDGRFDAICLYVYLLIRRLNQGGEPGSALAQGVFDAMFSDMDTNLREMGVGDMSIGKRNRKMWEAFHGRSAAYADAWDHQQAPGDDATGKQTTGGQAPGENTTGEQGIGKQSLDAAIARNVWRGAEPPSGSASALARLAHAQAAALSAQPFEVLAQGQVQFLPAQEAAR